MKFIYKIIVFIGMITVILSHSTYASYNNNLVCDFSPQTVQFKDRHCSYKVKMNTLEFFKKWQIDKFSTKTGTQIAWQDDDNWEKYKIIPIPEGIYCIDIKENQSIEYYMDLLFILVRNAKERNTMISNGFYNNEKMLKLDNYMNQFEAQLLFVTLVSNVTQLMKNSNLLQQYNLKQIIQKFNRNYMEYINDNKYIAIY